MPRSKINQFYYKDILKAWEGLNEFMFHRQDYFEDNGYGIRFGSQLSGFNNFMVIESCWLDPEFDFGKVLGYRTMKWTSLVNNYVDLNKLDILRANVMNAIKKKKNNFNLSMTFSNIHGNGKGCLNSITCSRRAGEKNKDTISFNLRSSEITRRLIFDFLLVQRMAEHIYGEKGIKDIRMEMFSNQMYHDAEAFSIYHNHKNLYKLSKELDAEKSDWGKKCMDVLRFMVETHPDDIKFRAHKRSSEAIWRADGRIKDGGYQSMKAKDLIIHEPFQKLPKKAITLSEIKKYKKI